MADYVTRRNLARAVVLCGVIVATNRYAGSPDENPPFAPFDTVAYQTMAQSAPGLPETTLDYQYAQRFALPYLLGTVNRVVPVRLHRLFQVAVVVIELAIVLLVGALLDHLRLAREQAWLVLALIVWNPWAFREYLTFPEMIDDPGFMLGAAVLLSGLVTGNGGLLLAGQILASLCRQTGLLLVPMAVVWLWRGGGVWASASRSRRRWLCAGVVGIGVGLYGVTGWVASGFAGSSENIQHVVGLWIWVGTEFDGLTLAVFLARLVIAPALVLAVAAALRSPRVENRDEVYLLILGALCIAAQPLLAGPGITGGNGPRLVAQALLPLGLVLGIVIRDSGVFAGTHRWRQYGAIVLVALASLHHLYVFDASPTPAQRALFAVLYASSCVGIFMIAHAERRSQEMLVEHDVLAEPQTCKR
jgi:hypothetical protein